MQDTNNVICKGAPVLFPLAGNLSGTTPAVPLLLRGHKEGFRTSRNDRQKITSIRNLQSPIRNEKGIALVMVLILAAIALMIMAGLIFMVTSSTQISGMQKRYKTALEAGKGGAEITYQFIALRGEDAENDALKLDLTSINPDISTPVGCTGTDISGTTYTGAGVTPGGFAAKLNTPTTSWSATCNSTMSINPSIATSYDLKYELGSVGNPTYTVYAKIVDTVEGNSAPDKGLGGKGVVVSGSGEVTVASMPYLYTVEVDAQNADNPLERSKLSILYQY